MLESVTLYQVYQQIGRAMAESTSAKPEIVIKKYANRRLYNTETSSYITLDYLSGMVKENREFKVVDAKTGDDITRQVLTQIIVEEESRGQTMLPVAFLRQLISMYGDNLQSMVPQYLESSMEAFRRNQEQFRSALEGAFSGTAFGPFEKIAKQNMKMFEAASEMFGASGVKTPGKPDNGEKPSADTDLEDLKAQMKALQAKLEKLSGK